MSETGLWAKHGDPLTVDELFHRLWSKAVGTPDYVKGQWRLLGEVLSRGLKPSMKIPEDLKTERYR
jgi:hypothetical protein